MIELESEQLNWICQTELEDEKLLR